MILPWCIAGEQFQKRRRRMIASAAQRRRSRGTGCARHPGTRSLKSKACATSSFGEQYVQTNMYFKAYMCIWNWKRFRRNIFYVHSRTSFSCCWYSLIGNVGTDLSLYLVGMHVKLSLSTLCGLCIRRCGGIDLQRKRVEEHELWWSTQTHLPGENFAFQGNYFISELNCLIALNHHLLVRTQESCPTVPTPPKPSLPLPPDASSPASTNLQLRLESTPWPHVGRQQWQAWPSTRW